MKVSACRSMLVAILLSPSVAPAWARVSRVVVYPDRAAVTRTTEVRCADGTIARFEGLPPAAEPRSFQAHVSGGTAEGLRWDRREREQAFSPAVEALTKQKARLVEERRSHQDALARARAQAALARRYLGTALTLMKGEMVGEAPDVRAWGLALDRSLVQQAAAAQTEASMAPRLRAIGRELEAVNDDLAQRRAAATRGDLAVEVLVRCPTGRSATVELTYVVAGASWAPAYEARVNEQNGTVDLGTWATVRQATEEPWTGAQVVLATALARQDASPPDPRPLIVRARERAPRKKVLVTRAEAVPEGQYVGSVGNSSGTGTGTTARADAQGASVSLELPGRVDVAGDGTPARLLVGRTRLAATFSLLAVPKAAPGVFRIARTTNSAPFPLLPGVVDVFRRGSFATRYPLEQVPTGGRFDLTLGVDENVRAERIEVESADKKTGWLRSGREVRYAYRFRLTNDGERPEQLEVADHVPVSELEDVKVIVDPKTTAGYQREPTEGIVTWRVRLAPGERRLVDLVFRLEIPDSYDVR